jgi:hypothetical protein
MRKVHQLFYMCKSSESLVDVLYTMCVFVTGVLHPAPQGWLGSQVVLINSNVRFLDSTLILEKVNFKLTNSTLVLNKVVITKSQYLSTVKGSFTGLPKPTRPFTSLNSYTLTATSKAGIIGFQATSK